MAIGLHFVAKFKINFQGFYLWFLWIEGYNLVLNFRSGDTRSGILWVGIASLKLCFKVALTLIEIR